MYKRGNNFKRKFPVVFLEETSSKLLNITFRDISTDTDMPNKNIGVIKVTG